MLKLYDHLDIIMEEYMVRQRHYESRFSRFASDIMEALAIEDMSEVNTALDRSFQALEKLNIPVELHFKKIYRFDGENLIVDWKISGLGCYLIIINANTSHEPVARGQLYFAINT